MSDLAARLRAEAAASFTRAEYSPPEEASMFLATRRLLIEAAERIEREDELRRIAMESAEARRATFLPNVTGEQYEADRKRLTDYGKDGGF